MCFNFAFLAFDCTQDEKQRNRMGCLKCDCPLTFELRSMCEILASRLSECGKIAKICMTARSAHYRKICNVNVCLYPMKPHLSNKK